MRYFITGATGFIGSHFLRAYAAKAEIFTLIRATDEEQAKERLRRRVQRACDAYPETAAVDCNGIRHFLGDIEAPGLGIDSKARKYLRACHIDTFWHFAANLSFEDERADKIAKTNIGGVKHALEVAADFGVKHFVYMSTAYAAGTKTGRVREALHDPGGPFSNHYERTKCAAEHIVAEFCSQRGMEFTILRPSVIVGVSSTKRPGGSSTGIYSFVRDLYFLRRAIESIDISPRLAADRDMIVNLNPVDGVIADIEYLVENGFPGGPVHHLTASYGARLGDAFELARRVMGIERFRVVDKDEPVRTPIDELIGRRAQFYKGYLFYEKDFERSIPLEHGCTLRDIGGYVRSYVDELDAQHSTSRLQAERLRLSDGVEVDTHRLTQVARREAILIINAFGMPVDFWLQFMNRAGRQYDLYTWETRYLPGSGVLCETDISMDRHVLDAVEVLDRYDIGTAHVLGWCTGAKLALRMSLQYCNRVASLTMLSGGFNIGQEELRTAYERSASDILTDISASEDIAELYYDLIYNGNQHNSEADATARSVLQATNANYVQYTSLPFSSPESIYRYAQLLTTFLEDREIGDLGSIEVPTLTITAKTDPSTHPGASRYVAERIPGARHLELEDGDHYLMDSHADVVFGQVHKHIQTAMRSDALVGT